MKALSKKQGVSFLDTKGQFILLAVLCVFANFYFNQVGENYFNSLALILTGGLMIGAIWTLLEGSVSKEKVKGLQVSVMVLGSFWLFQMGLFLSEMMKRYAYGNAMIEAKVVIIFAVSLSCIALIMVEGYKKKKLHEEQLILMVILLGFCTRLAYVLFTSILGMQNDAGSFEANTYGHLGYIYYFYEKGHLPDFDPRLQFQFYHPPLHHILGALWVKFNLLFGLPIERAAENIQILTLFYSTGMLIIVNDLLKKLQVKSFARLMAVSLAAFYPYMIMTAGAINNDCLLTFLMLIAMDLTLKWYETGTLKDIIAIALAIGGAMMTKVSAAYIAPAIAFLFLMKLVKAKKERLNYIQQMVIFGCIALPLGLWHPIRNKLLYNIPFGYVPKITEDCGQYIGMYNSLKERLLQMTPGQLGQFNIGWDTAHATCDYNIFLALLKFGTFGESPYYLWNPVNKFMGSFMFLLVCLLSLILLIASIKWVLKGKQALEIRWFFWLIMVCVMGSYLVFCFKFPHICTMNVRYVLIAILSSIICFGAELGESLEEEPSQIKVSVASFCLLFGLVSILLTVCYFMFA